MLSVELRVDVTGSPHTFLVITGPDNIERGYGLAPYVAGEWPGAGWIHDDTEHPFDSSTGKIPLTVDEYNRLVDYINTSRENPPTYDPYFGSQCANWAVKGLIEAGIPALAEPNLLPDNILRDIFETIIWNPYTQWLNIKLNDFFAAARGWYPRDPLAIDLDGDGIETVGVAGGVLFDHDGDGIRTGTGWVKSDDAFVVLDRNGNGSIDTGAELFGVDYVKASGQKALNGFDALADLDGNADGLFNASDAQYASVRLWRDMNQDGISQANELQSLSQAGIAAIDLAAQTVTQDFGNGNTQTLTAATAGIVGDTVALDLADNPFYREFPDHLDTTAVANLPDMQGAGRVRDLKEAATLSTTLANQLADLQATYRTHDQFEAALDSLILNWANTSDWSTTPVDFQMVPVPVGVGDPAGLPIAETSPGLHLMQASGGMVPYAIIYQPQGITKEQLAGACRVPLPNTSSGGGSSGTSSFDPNAPTTTALPEKYLRAVYLIETLERYNGLPFINFNIETGAVTTATGRAIPPEQAGGGSVQLYPIPVYVPINDAQLNLLEESYASLKQSISDGLAAPRDSRRWRDGTRRHAPRLPYGFRRIDLPSGRRYPAGIHIQTRRQTGKQAPHREARPGASVPVSTVIKGVTAMRRRTNQQRANASCAAGKTRRWQDCDPCANGEWRRVA